MHTRGQKENRGRSYFQVGKGDIQKQDGKKEKGRERDKEGTRQNKEYKREKERHQRQFKAGSNNEKETKRHTGCGMLQTVETETRAFDHKRTNDYVPQICIP